MLLSNGFLGFLLFLGFSTADGTTRLYLLVPLASILTLLAAFLKWCFIALLQDRITLELDEEKLQYHISGQTIYWKDVVEISEDYGRYHSGIKYEMVDGSDDLKVSTTWIKSSTISICNKMHEFFAHTFSPANCR